MTHTSAADLIAQVLDPGSFVSWDTAPDHGEISEDYAGTLARAQARTGHDEAIISGEGTVHGHPVAFILGEFNFLGGSIGQATSRRIIDAIHQATARKLPLLVSPCSGGTRMQEGTKSFSLMISITTAVYRHKEAHLPYLVYLRNPVMGGVMASWGSAGHFTFAEPGALLGFLGPRVVELTTGTPMPEGVQTAENLAAKGIIDGVLAPSQLREAVEKIIHIIRPCTLTSAPPALPAVTPDLNQDAWGAIEASRNPQRPGLKQLLEVIGARNIICLSGSGDGRTSPVVTCALARIKHRPVVLIGQDRHEQPPFAQTELGPAALRVARRGISLAHELQLPLVSIIDSPGAELSQFAEEHAIAGSIGRTLGELVYLDTPTVSVILGQGCGGGALAMLPSDVVLAAENAWLSPLPPEGASAILYRDVEHAPQLMQHQEVSAHFLLKNRVVDGIIPEQPDAAAEPEEFSRRVVQAIAHSLWELEHNPKRVGREQRFRHYEQLA